MPDITSVKNEKIKAIAGLLEKSKVRREKELFIVEGFRELSNCIKAGFRIESIFFNPDITDTNKIGRLFSKPINESFSTYALHNFPVASPHIYSVSKEVYAKIAYREGTEGIVAVVKEKRLGLQDIILNKRDNIRINPEKTSGILSGGSISNPPATYQNPLILVIESVEKPGNLGALLRTADACGVDAVLVCDPLTDLYNPNLIRSSLGGIFTRQVVACTNEEAYKWLSSNNIAILTAQIQDSEWYYDTDMTLPCAIVMGSEAKGLTGFWRNVSNAKIKIPMLGEIDSLNVSVSAAILCYEAVRQRSLGNLLA